MNDASNVPEFTVSEISGAVKRTLEGQFSRVRVRGEITELKRYPSGHIYFSLKDEGGKLSGIVWKGSVSRLGMVPENGVEVIATGKLSAYGERSGYQLIVDAMDFAGAGALLARIEALRLRLAEEGLFDPVHKRPLPLVPAIIGVVSSPQGAVIQDIHTTIARRFPRPVILWPVPVQGDGAAAKIAAAIAGFDSLPRNGVPRPDVLIVARGGGSLEDLMAFNDEAVLRAAAACRIPLISAVGHETDTTLIDFVSDRRAPTPTAAAEMAIPARAELAADLQHKAARLAGGLHRMAQAGALAVHRAATRLPDLPGLVGAARQRVDDRRERLHGALPNLLAQRRAALVRAERDLPHPRTLMAARRAQLAMTASGIDHGWRRDLASRRHSAACIAARLTPATLHAQNRDNQARLDDKTARLHRCAPVLIMECKKRLAQLDRFSERGLQHAIAVCRHSAAEIILRLSTMPLQAQGREMRVRLEGLQARLDGASPLAILARGYALVTDSNQRPVTSAAAVRPGGKLQLRFTDGEIRTTADRQSTAIRQGMLALD